MSKENEPKDKDLIESGRGETGKDPKTRHQEVTVQVGKNSDGTEKKKGGDDGDGL